MEALFAGEEARVDEMLNACREGPLAARVSNVSVENIDDTDVPGSFELRQTV